MAHTQTYKKRALVLRKTKLGEKDLIVTLLSNSGELMRCVAKGARKPGGSFAAKLELFSAVDLMAAKGRSLDVVTDVRFAEPAGVSTFGLEQTTCASPVAELLSTICQEGLEQPRLYDMAYAAFGRIARSSAEQALAICAASLVKIISAAGFRPALAHCHSCGNPIGLQAGKNVLFSVDGGGATCQDCARQVEGFLVDVQAIAWTNAFLTQRFDEILAQSPGPSTSFAVLQLQKPWIEHYAGRRLKSLDYLLTCGLF